MRSLTWQEEGGPGGDVDLLKMLQSLRVKEADGRARGEGHPDTAAGFHHVSDTHRLILVRLEALLHTEEMEVSGHCRPALPPQAPFSRVNCSHSPQEHKLSKALPGHLSAPGLRSPVCCTDQHLLQIRFLMLTDCDGANTPPERSDYRQSM